MSATPILSRRRTASKPADQVSVMEITPTTAAQLLEANKHNRPLRAALVRKYAHDMSAGNWRFDGTPVGIAHDGTILNGQHRLTAIVMSETTQTMVVVRGLDRGVQEIMDSGAARTAGDAAALRGLSNSSALAAIARRAYAWDTGRRNGGMRGADGGSYAIPITNSDILAYIDKHSDLAHAATVGTTGAKTLPGVTPAILGFLFFVTARIDAAAAGVFWVDQVINTLGLKQGAPAGALRRTLTSASVEGRRLTETEVVGYALRAWNAFRDGDELAMLKAPTGTLRSDGTRKNKGWSAANLPDPR